MQYLSLRYAYVDETWRGQAVSDLEIKAYQRIHPVTVTILFTKKAKKLRW